MNPGLLLWSDEQWRDGVAKKVKQQRKKKKKKKRTNEEARLPSCRSKLDTHFEQYVPQAGRQNYAQVKASTM